MNQQYKTFRENYVQLRPAETVKTCNVYAMKRIMFFKNALKTHYLALLVLRK